MTEQDDCEPADGPKQHARRRTSDTILVAFHHACDQKDIEVAWELLNVLEFMAMRMATLPTGVERRVTQGLVAAHERLWQIRHPS